MQISDNTFREKSLHFWRSKIDRYLPLLELPHDIKKEGGEKKGAAFQILLGAERTEVLKRVSRESQTSIFMYIFPIFILLQSRFSSQKDILSSIIHAGREHEGLNNIVGFFVNPLLTRIQVKEEEPFVKFLDRVKEDILETFKHQNYPLEMVFEDIRMKYPEISVSFNMLNISDWQNIERTGEYQLNHVPEVQDVKFDMEPYVIEYTNNISIYWTYKRELFYPETIKLMISEYIEMLDFFSKNIEKSYKDYKQHKAPKTRHFFRKK
jgi:iturin family lipopeptide synthetase A